MHKKENITALLTKCDCPCFPLVPPFFQELLQKGDWRWVFSPLWPHFLLSRVQVWLHWLFGGGEKLFLPFWQRNWPLHQDWLQHLHRLCSEPALIFILTRPQKTFFESFLIPWFEGTLVFSWKAGNVSENSPIFAKLPFQPAHTHISFSVTANCRLWAAIEQEDKTGFSAAVWITWTQLSIQLHFPRHLLLPRPWCTHNHQSSRNPSALAWQFCQWDRLLWKHW